MDEACFYLIHGCQVGFLNQHKEKQQPVQFSQKSRVVLKSFLPFAFLSILYLVCQDTLLPFHPCNNDLGKHRMSGKGSAKQNWHIELIVLNWY